ncbi:MAG: TetR/AcrR family transcriptional regulator [Steroidobacteraceae bacterium]
MPQPLKFRRLPKDQRDQTRRDQIVRAARRCVVRRGFHAASMAEIAATARMSVGQIYRYFPSKEAIVHAIVERIVAQRLQGVAAGGFGSGVPARVARRFVCDFDEELRADHILMLEITAEATRNAEVARIVREADRRLHDEAVAIFRQQLPALTEPAAAARLELFAALADGTMLRRVVGQRARGDDLVQLYQDIIGRLLSPQRGMG